MKICDSVQDRLAEAGAVALQGDAEARDHLAGCADCTEVLAGLARLDAALGDLPAPDAPDALVAGTLAAVRGAAREGRHNDQPRGGWRLAGGALAACVVVIASLVVVRNYLASQHGYLATQEIAQVSEAEPESAVTLGDIVDRRLSAQRSAEVSLDEVTEAVHSQSEVRTAPNAAGAPALRKQEKASRPTLTGGSASWEDNDRLNEESLLIARLQTRTGGARSETQRGFGLETEDSEVFANKPASEFPGVKAKKDGDYGESADGKHRAMKPAESGVAGGVMSGPDSEPDGGFRSDRFAARNYAPEQERGRAGGGAGFHDDESGALSSYLERPDRPRLLAQDFLRRADSLEPLVFQEATGYWANSYIPGDPAMRLLRLRLRDWDRGALGADVRLEQGVRQVGQPFDAPSRDALAVYLHSDRAAIEGPGRLRLQVGLKGAERQGGHRPAMNVGLVVDTRAWHAAALAEDGAGQRIRALITALQRARQPGDRFSLTLAGPGGGMLVPPEQFRHGPLRVAIDRIFAAPRDPVAPDLDLPRAVALAAESVRRGDDPNAILGSSLVLLVTGSSLDGDLAVLEPMAHRNAVGGVSLSVVDLGTADLGTAGPGAGADPAEIDRLVAAGQGNRRILETAAGADALIDRELHAASRAVARAVRLRIRLAPGVKLVDVLGSRRLEEPEAGRVREAEQSIDRRLARNLGIEADRGEDEDGIQIVIPNFHAGDAHVVLLDLVAEGPGPIADVQVRYKDVVRLENGVAEAALSLDRGAGTPGPLERNVLKNLVAWQLARETRRIGWLLEAGDVATAVSLLARQRDLVQGLRLEVPGWSGDPDLADDEAMLGEYLAVLEGPAAGDAAQRRYLAQSLRYAAFSKLQSAAR